MTLQWDYSLSSMEGSHDNIGQITQYKKISIYCKGVCPLLCIMMIDSSDTGIPYRMVRLNI